MLREGGEGEKTGLEGHGPSEETAAPHSGTQSGGSWSRLRHGLAGLAGLAVHSAHGERPGRTAVLAAHSQQTLCLPRSRHLLQSHKVGLRYVCLQKSPCYLCPKQRERL